MKQSQFYTLTAFIGLAPHVSQTVAIWTAAVMFIVGLILAYNEEN